MYEELLGSDELGMEVLLRWKVEKETKRSLPLRSLERGRCADWIDLLELEGLGEEVLLVLLLLRPVLLAEWLRYRELE
ncbi:hypothetical protein RIR_jg35060.t1 [Rhizophagus irregularis DAOM 181602=DAOM 197198]|nr:hypothetical protein RIR_jg35060.t1 [Rhizophagus irregularis DAOM 181602=DAOM 197198]